MYAVRVLRIRDSSEWQPSPDKPFGGAGPTVEGAWLAKRVTVECYTVDALGAKLATYEVRDFLIEEPYSTQKLIDAVDAYKAALPVRNEDEGLVL